MQYLHAVTGIITAAGVLATLLAHAPFVPQRLQALLARFGVASSKFSVEVKDVVP